MRILLISNFYSDGMGYTENCLPSALQALGHEVHVIASTLQVYGNSPDYDRTYGGFLGPRAVPPGTMRRDNVTIHRLPYKLVGSYVFIKGLWSRVHQIKPDIIQLTEAASLNTFWIAAWLRTGSYGLFSECHQHASILRSQVGNAARHFGVGRVWYWLTRTLPVMIAHRRMEKCFAISADTAQVAHDQYGIPRSKIYTIPLGTVTDQFRPAEDSDEVEAARLIRCRLGISPADILCIYTGRLSKAKNPRLLAQAVERLRAAGKPFAALFIGEGQQEQEIRCHRGSCVVPFMKARDLPTYYRASDVGVWPSEESMSMLDCAACGLPIVCNDAMGDMARVEGNGLTFHKDNLEDLIRVLERLAETTLRRQLGAAGRVKMVEWYSWSVRAKERLKFYEKSYRRGSRERRIRAKAVQDTQASL